MKRPFFAFHFHKQKDKPLSVQLAEQLQVAISRGAFLQGGDQLVSLREMKEISGCSLETVKKAYDLLVAKGWLEAARGKGYYLTAHSKLARDRLYLQSLQLPMTSLADSTPTPTDELVRRLRHVLTHSLESLGEHVEDKKVRRMQAITVFYEHLASRGIPLQPEQLLVFHRSTNSFHFLVQNLFHRNDVVLVEEYSYPFFLRILRHHGVTVRPVRLDEEGISLQSLEQEHRLCQAKWLLVNPHFHFPTGISYSRKRKLSLLDWASRSGVRIVENDHHGDLWFRHPSRTLFQFAAEMANPVPVYYLHSLSKTLAKEFQVGLLVLPGGIDKAERDWIRESFSLATVEPSLLVLDAAARLLQDSWFREVYLPDRRALFASRWQLLQQEIRQALPAHANLLPIKGGLNTWIQWGAATLHATSQEKRIVAMLREEGLELTPGYAFRVSEEQEDGRVLRRPSVRFPLSPLDERELCHWLHRLGAALIR